MAQRQLSEKSRARLEMILDLQFPRGEVMISALLMDDADFTVWIDETFLSLEKSAVFRNVTNRLEHHKSSHDKLEDMLLKSEPTPEDKGS